jgi:hypothetical protein
MSQNKYATREEKDSGGGICVFLPCSTLYNLSQTNLLLFLTKLSHSHLNKMPVESQVAQLAADEAEIASFVQFLWQLFKSQPYVGSAVASQAGIDLGVNILAPAKPSQGDANNSGYGSLLDN